jgi:hypothetical protein
VSLIVTGGEIEMRVLVLALLIALPAAVAAQESKERSETAEDLRMQRIEVQAKEEGLKVRAQQLDEDLKPDNIERALAGIGSTKPEDLREARRRQLSIERESVRAQLKILEVTRTRLETAIANAEARAYQESALPVSSPPVNALSANSLAFSPSLILCLLSLLCVSVSPWLLMAARRNHRGT